MKDYKNKSMSLAAGLVDFFGSLFLFWLPRPKIGSAKIRKILILKFDRIGDTFLAEPAIAALRKVFPAAVLAAAVAPWNYEVLAGNPHIDELLKVNDLPDVHSAGSMNFFDVEKIKIIRNMIMDEAPNLAIDLQGSPMNVMAMFGAGVPWRAGFGNKILSFLLTNKARYKNNQPQGDIYLSLAKALGYQDAKDRPRIYADGRIIDEVRSFWERGQINKYVVFHLTAGRTYRQWPLPNFIELARKILADYPDFKIVVIGGEADRAFFKQLAAVDENRIKEFLNQPLAAVYELLKGAAFFIGNESGPGHLAASLDIPVISLMNPWSGVDRWKAEGRRVHIFYKQAHHCAGPKCHADPCPNMAAIAVAEVWEAFKANIS